jgi:hypothetical protein
LPASRVAPTVVTLVASIPNTNIAWSDAGDRFALEGDINGLRRADRIQSDATVEWFNLPRPLSQLGDDAPRFLDAYAAAVAPRRLSLCWRVGSVEPRSRAFRRAQNAVLVASLGGALAFGALGPGIRASRFARTAERELAGARSAQLEIGRSQAELRRVTQTLNGIESFRVEHAVVTRILGDLGRVLPESTALLTFHVDSVEGAFTAVAPHVADVLPELANVTQIVSPRIVGSVTREVMSGIRIERATFRFRRMTRARSASPRASR